MDAQMEDAAPEVSVTVNDSSDPIVPDDIVETTPEESAEAFKAQGNDAYRKGLYGRAIDHYSEAIAVKNDVATYYANRAAAKMAVQQYASAVEDCRLSLVLDNQFTKAYLRGSTCLVQLGEFEKALELLASAVKSTKSIVTETERVSSVYARYDSAVKLIEGGDFGAAIPIMTSLLDVCSHALRLRLMLVEAMIAQDNADRALLICNSLYKDYSNDINVIYWRGACLYYVGNLSTAVKHCQEVLRRDPDNRRARVLFKRIRKLEAGKERGNLLYKQGRLMDALEAFTETSTIDPDNRLFNAQLYCNRAATHMKLKQHSEALSDCKQAIELKPDYIKAYVRLGTCQVEAGECEDGVRTLEDVQRRDPEYDGIREKIRWAKLELKKSKRKDYYKILEVDKGATSYEIKKAYRRAALKWHPDKNRGSPEDEEKAEAMFKDIGEAYNVLSDDRLRQRYDSGADLQDEPMAHADVNEIFQMFFRGGGGGGGFGF